MMKQSNTKKLYILAIVALAAAVIIAVCTFAFGGNDKTASEPEPETTASEEVVEDEEESEEETELQSEIEKMLVGKTLNDVIMRFGTYGEMERDIKILGDGSAEYIYINQVEENKSYAHYTVEGDSIIVDVPHSSLEEAASTFKLSLLDDSSIVVAECKCEYTEDGKDKTDEYKTYFVPIDNEERGTEKIYDELANKTFVSKYLAEKSKSDEALIKITLNGKGEEKRFDGNVLTNESSSEYFDGQALGNNIATFREDDCYFIVEIQNGKPIAYFYNQKDDTLTKEVLKEAN